MNEETCKSVAMSNTVRELMPEIKGMIWGEKPRLRLKAERLILIIVSEVSGWRKYSLTWSRVTERIRFEKTGPRSGMLVNAQGDAWDSELRGDEYWEGVGQIIVWYVKQVTRYKKVKE